MTISHLCVGVCVCLYHLIQDRGFNAHPSNVAHIYTYHIHVHWFTIYTHQIFGGHFRFSGIYLVEICEVEVVVGYV